MAVEVFDKASKMNSSGKLHESLPVYQNVSDDFCCERFVNYGVSVAGSETLSIVEIQRNSAHPGGSNLLGEQGEGQQQERHCVIGAMNCFLDVRHSVLMEAAALSSIGVTVNITKKMKPFTNGFDLLV